MTTTNKHEREVELHNVTAPTTARPVVRIAIVSGLLAFICFLLTPFMPVNQVQSHLSWPQNDSLESVNAPLISLAPDHMELSVPVSASLEALRNGQTTILGTLPDSSSKASDRGLFINSPDGGLVVTALDEVIFELTKNEVSKLPADARLTVVASPDETTVEIPGTQFKKQSEEDLRPQVTGLYTELEGQAQSLVDAGLDAQVEINSRFTSTPTVAKSAVMWIGLLSTVVALWSLWRLDAFDGKRVPFLRRQWRTFKPLDGLVLAILGFWHVFGANTSDDGYLLTMARVASKSDYMANYYRWYGVPESPFGSPFYDILSLLANGSTASMWMRLPTLLAGMLIWWILSREILPRLGRVVAQRRVAYWTAAFVFLAFWLPYNNGTRPEPIIALGLIATWALFERSVATDRLFPAAIGTLTAAFTLACGPTGLAAVGVFLVFLPSLFRVMRGRLVIATQWAYLVPFLGIGFAVMIPVFHDQTLASVLEATSVRSQVGPALEWYSEWARYATLFAQSVDGSMGRRFPVFIFLFSIILIVWALVRFGKIPGAAQGPAQRLLLIIGLSAFFLMFTPTKWTHHFGIFAGVGGAVAALGAVVLSQIAMRSARNRTLALAAVLFIMSLTLAGWNGWWYVSSFGVPWWDRTVQFKAIEANTVMLVLTLVVFFIGIFQSLRHNSRRAQAAENGAVEEFDRHARVDHSRFSGVMSAPIALFAVLMVAFSCLTFLKAFVDQAPAYSVGMGNVRSFGGNTCALGSDVLLETNTNDSFLTPVSGVPLGRSLDSGDNRGFHPEGVPAFIVEEGSNAATTAPRSDAEQSQPDTVSSNTNTGTGSSNSQDDQLGTTQDTPAGTAQDADATTEEEQSTTRTNTQGNRPASQEGINGSTVRLPFNLDYQRIPVLGTFSEAPEGSASIETAWFELPEATEDAPLLVASAAGRIAHEDINGVHQEGSELLLEYGTRRPDGSIDLLGKVTMFDQGPKPSWRNLRYPIEDLPDEADVVRLVGEDTSLAEDDWMAITPLRAPRLEPLGEVFDQDTPGLLDWTVAFQYPCQRTFNHFGGVAEIPEYRIMPDAPGKAELSGFMDFLGGGALATAEAVNYSYDIPGYLDNDWSRDWGSIAKYERRTNSAGQIPATADISHTDTLRWGWWSPGPMKIRDPHENAS